ncbi:hypothetical protein [Sorangium sp. So ce1182]|uniref:hypothetical protein n=1 Tax=Sorangium sp. So ce1182 TaxID=3133334 RepID=UPI003F611492
MIACWHVLPARAARAEERAEPASPRRPTRARRLPRGGGHGLLCDGRILAGGTRDDRLAIVRFNADGGVDQAFGASGVAAIDRAFGSDTEGFDVAVQSDGGIVAVGVAAAGNRGVVVRFTSAGDVDGAFGGGGVVAIEERPFHGLAVGEGA